jgi:hypothetical protein
MKSTDRFAELMSRMLDDTLSDSDLAELHTLVSADPTLRLQLVDHLLLDSLLAESLGQEPLTALVDLVGDSSKPMPPTAREPSSVRTLSKSTSLSGRHHRPWMSGWLVVAASLFVAITFFLLQSDREALANPSMLVQSAMHSHAAPIERVYVVEVKRSEPNEHIFEFPKDVRIATQGDRFWVQMRGLREWAWGRNETGAMWMTLGSRRAVVVNSNEMGIPLRNIGDLYSLNLETLLQNLLKHCDLKMSDGPVDSTILVATMQPKWSKRPFKRATIEVDRETKAIRKLIIERDFERFSSTSTFTLVDSRLADESKYGPEGHLTKPYRIFSHDTNTERRHDMMSSWFGPMSDQWIQRKEAQADE